MLPCSITEKGIETFGLTEPQHTNRQKQRLIISTVWDGFARRSRWPFRKANPLSFVKSSSDKNHHKRHLQPRRCPLTAAVGVLPASAPPNPAVKQLRWPGCSLARPEAERALWASYDCVALRRRSALFAGISRRCRFRPFSCSASRLSLSTAGLRFICLSLYCMRICALYIQVVMFFSCFQELIFIPLQGAGLMPPWLRMF